MTVMTKRGRGRDATMRANARGLMRPALPCRGRWAFGNPGRCRWHQRERLPRVAPVTGAPPLTPAFAGPGSGRDMPAPTTVHRARLQTPGAVVITAGTSSQVRHHNGGGFRPRRGRGRAAAAPRYHAGRPERG